MDRNTTIHVMVPERALSETLLDFAAPLLEDLGPTPDPVDVRTQLDVVVRLWNALVLSGPHWQKSGPLEALRKVMCGSSATSASASAFKVLSERSIQRFSFDPRVVTKWNYEPDSHDRCKLSCEYKLPPGTIPYVPPPAALRITIDGRFLDDVYIPIGTPRASRTYGVNNHRVEVALDGAVTLHTEAALVVQLFAEGVLKRIGGVPVEIVTGGVSRGPMVLVQAYITDASRSDQHMSLVFRRATITSVK
jgi:hypothetical protein